MLSKQQIQKLFKVTPLRYDLLSKEHAMHLLYSEAHDPLLTATEYLYLIQYIYGKSLKKDLIAFTNATDPVLKMMAKSSAHIQFKKLEIIHTLTREIVPDLLVKLAWLEMELRYDSRQ